MDNTTTINGQDLSSDDNHADLLTLSLSTFHRTPAAPPPPLLINPALSAFHHPLPPPPSAAISIPSPSSSVARPRRQRRNPSRTPSAGKSPTIPPPYPWATDRRATVHSLDYLISRQISAVSGDVECKRCERRYSVEFDLRQKFSEVGSYIAAHKSSMHQRAPAGWCSPALLRCRFCEQDNSARPLDPQGPFDI
ncbi:hydroxyproline-rich glycoprotein family protein [Striga asiatica]|uniref:Hydroxyproline-rich glycoprotein family protein n=1 Tax=Striga asiatica TaxID=4170 RepID=A0A5A7P8C0_STRAF|nr:hydroxyproline-rich glycoprotein family protein [Striga asiatica]